MDIFTGILLIHFCLYTSLTGIHVQLHAITRCASESCESGVGLYPHCSDCTKFIYCVFGYAVERKCPDNLVFDIKFGVCNLPERSQCWNSNLALRYDTSSNSNQSPRFNGKLTIPKQSKDNLLPKMNTTEQLSSTTSSVKKQPGKKASRRKQVPHVKENTERPTSMMTNEPPSGIDADGHAIVGKVDPVDEAAKDELQVSMKTDDPPGEWNTESTISSALNRQSENNKAVKSNSQNPKQNDESENTDSPPEEWNRDYSINPDFPNGDTKESVTEAPTSLKDETDLPEDWNRDYSINPDFPEGRNLKDQPETGNSSDSRVKSISVSKTTHVPKPKVPCVTDCNGMPYGNYQSCYGCSLFISCMWGIKLENSCIKGLYWDDISKLCVKNSSTCA